jgi:hypothetical protein
MPATHKTTTSPTTPKLRLRRSDCSGPGIRRVKRGRGFSYAEASGQRVSDPEQLLRIHELAIPPAWGEVWICPDPAGHLQATGIDAAGRKQYLYHARWRELRDQKKFDHMADFARSLPRLRRSIAADLTEQDMSETRVLACAVRLLDVGLFRIGSEQYADEDGGVGLATAEKQNVSVHDGSVVFDYLGKGGIHRRQEIIDPTVREVVRALKRRRGGGDQLLAYRRGRRWYGVRSDQIRSATTSSTRSATRSAPRTFGPGTPPCSRPLPSRPTDVRRRRRLPGDELSAAPWPASPRSSGTLPRWRESPTSIHGCSIVTSRGGRSAPRSTKPAPSTDRTTGLGGGSSWRCWNCSTTIATRRPSSRSPRRLIKSRPSAGVDEPGRRTLSL